mgnify:CR=1 FL=1
MASINRNKSLSKWLSSYSNLKPLQSSVNIILILLGPLLAIATYLFLGPFNVAGQSIWLRFFLLLDLVYVLLIVGIVLDKFFKEQAEESLLHAQLAGEKIAGLDGHPSQKIAYITETNNHSILKILQESLEHEEHAVTIYKKLLAEVSDKSVMLEEYAREKIGMEEQHALEIEKMLRDFGNINAS